MEIDIADRGQVFDRQFMAVAKHALIHALAGRVDDAVEEYDIARLKLGNIICGGRQCYPVLFKLAS